VLGAVVMLGAVLGVVLGVVLGTAPEQSLVGVLEDRLGGRVGRAEVAVSEDGAHDSRSRA
jgi:hypothetical protein